MLQLQWVAEGGSAAGLPAPVAARRRSREKLAWGVAAARFCWPPRRSPTASFAARPKPPRLVRFEVPVPPNLISIDSPRISPDGQILAFNATDGGREEPDLGPAPERPRGPAAGGNGRSGAPLLVAGQQVRRLLLRRQAQEDRRRGRAAHQDLRRADRIRRDLEPGGRDPLRRHGQRSDSSRLRRGRHADRRRQAGRSAEGSADRLAGVHAGRPPLHLHVDQPEGRRQRVPDRPARLDRDEALCSGADDADLRAAGLSAVRARPDTRRAAASTRRPSRRQASRCRSPSRSGRTPSGSRGSRCPATECSRTGRANPGTAWSGWIDRARSSKSLGDPAEYGEPGLSPSGDRLAFDLRDPRAGQGRHLDPGSRAWRELAFHVRPGEHLRAPLVSPRGHDRVLLGPRGRLRPLRESRRTDRARRSSCSRPTSSRSPTSFSPDGRFLAYSSAQPEDGLGHLHPADDRRPQARPVRRGVVQRAHPDALARRALPRLRIQ